MFCNYAETAIPIFYWATREGSRIGRESAPHRCLKVIAIFARRPKVIVPNDDVIVAKLNKELFAYSAEAAMTGIPTLAGIPLVASLDQMTINCRTVWFRMDGLPSYDIELPLTLDGHLHQPCQNAHITGPDELKRFAAEVVEQAAVLRWEDALEALRQLRHFGFTSRFIPFGGGSTYKPFHMLLLE